MTQQQQQVFQKGCGGCVYEIVFRSWFPYFHATATLFGFKIFKRNTALASTFSS